MSDTLRDQAEALARAEQNATRETLAELEFDAATLPPSEVNRILWALVREVQSLARQIGVRP